MANYRRELRMDMNLRRKSNRIYRKNKKGAERDWSNINESTEGNKEVGR